jgi:hypothetical protein
MMSVAPPRNQLHYCITPHPLTGQTCFLELTTPQLYAGEGDSDFSVDLAWEVEGQVFVDSVMWSALSWIKPEPKPIH